MITFNYEPCTLILSDKLIIKDAKYQLQNVDDYLHKVKYSDTHEDLLLQIYLFKNFTRGIIFRKEINLESNSFYELSNFICNCAVSVTLELHIISSFVFILHRKKILVYPTSNVT